MPVSTEQAVIAILARQLGLAAQDICPETSLAALGLNSLGLVETIFAIEEAFEVTVPFNANTPESSSFDITSVGTVVAAVDGLIAAKPA